MRRRTAIVLAIATAAGAMLWTGAWVLVASRIESGVLAWVEARRAEGLTAEYRRLDVSGWPWRWRVEIEGPSMAGAGMVGTETSRWSWRGQALIVEVRPWAPGEMALTFPGEHWIKAGAGAQSEATLSAARPEGRAQLTEGGRLAGLARDLGEAVLKRAIDPGPTLIGRARVSIRPRRAEGGSTDGGLAPGPIDARAEIENVRLPAPPRGPLGANVQLALVDLSLKGRVPAGALGPALAAWRDDGGTIEINRARLAWGSFGLDGSGSFALDAHGRPLAAASARVTGYADGVDALVAAGLVRAREGAGAKIALNLLARAESAGRPGEVTLPLSAQDGQLFIAGIPLLRLQPLRLD